MGDGTLYLCRTITGDLRHLCRFPGGVTLCGHLVYKLERPFGGGPPIKFADHWRAGATDPAHPQVCENCEHKAP